ncbi:MAG: HHL1-like protein [Elainellaceae cyanobacterium]
MSTHGFGKTQSAKSSRSAKRTKAAQQYDRMRSDGTPDFEVYIRIQGKTQWYPVGAIAVKRSSQVNRAIFSSQDELLKGAFRLYPVLRKHQQNLEYGYRLKEFKDDPIQLAVPPTRTRGGTVQSVISQIKNRVLSLIKN